MNQDKPTEEFRSRIMTWGKASHKIYNDCIRMVDMAINETKTKLKIEIVDCEEIDQLKAKLEKCREALKFISRDVSSIKKTDIGTFVPNYAYINPHDLARQTLRDVFGEGEK